MPRVPFISLLTFLAIAACSARNPVDSRAASAAGLPEIDVPAPSAAGEPHGATMPGTASPRTAGAKIPASLEGRWALTPRDCTGSADAKGLLVVTADKLQFYESRAVPAGDVESDTHSIAGNFAFTGEGQNWTRYEALKVQKGILTRTETHPTVSFSYAKCS